MGDIFKMSLKNPGDIWGRPPGVPPQMSPVKGESFVPVSPRMSPKALEVCAVSGEQKAIPDRLAEVWARLAELEAEEKELRAILLDDPTTRDGGDYVATVQDRPRRVVQSESLRAADPVLWEKLAVLTVVRRVLVSRKKEAADAAD